MPPSAACPPHSMASVSRALRPRPCLAAPRLGCGLRVACAVPAYGGATEKAEWGLAIAPAPASTTSGPVLRSRQFLCKAEANISSNLPESIPAGPSQYEKIVELLTTLFPVWVILGTIIGIYKPSMVTWLETDLFTVGLGFLMLSMGLTLTFEDFRRCLRNPWTVGVGFLAQYLIKPMLGYAIALIPHPTPIRIITADFWFGGQKKCVVQIPHMTPISKKNSGPPRFAPRDPQVPGSEGLCEASLHPFPPLGAKEVSALPFPSSSCQPPPPRAAADPGLPRPSPPNPTGRSTRRARRVRSAHRRARIGHQSAGIDAAAPALPMDPCALFLLEDPAKQTVVILAAAVATDVRPRKRKGSTMGRLCIPRNPALGHTMLMRDYFAETLKLSAPLATGLILVSCCPGGQASNVATYISKGNVALSVLMTTCSTIGAIAMTPLLTKLLAGQLVPVDAAGLAISTFQVVLMPTIIGVLAHEYFPKFTERIIFVTPLIGVILTTLLCASPIGQVAEVLKTQGAQLILPVALLHAVAFALGYWLSKLSSFGESTSRTISIECGMQSSALGFLLAQKHFTNPLVAVPSAVSVVCMALGGSALAVFWRNRGLPVDDKDDFKE